MLFSRADWIRTNDLLNPIQALYQTELQPANFFAHLQALQIYIKVSIFARGKQKSFNFISNNR